MGFLLETHNESPKDRRPNDSRWGVDIERGAKVLLWMEGGESNADEESAPPLSSNRLIREDKNTQLMLTTKNKQDTID
jgi:hypothetical protein